tara:strand:- start:7773 stop:9656 length:1884 start_codon:yes stop_codon:yes gene_type:complete
MFDKSIINQGELFEVNSVEFNESNLEYPLIKSSKAEVLKFYKEADEPWRSNVTVCANVFKINALAIEHAPESIKNNKPLVLCAISNNIKAIEFIPQSLLEDEQIAAGIIKVDPCLALQRLPDSVLQKEKINSLLIQQMLLSSKLHTLSGSNFINRILLGPLAPIFSSNNDYLSLIHKLLRCGFNAYKYLPDKLKNNKEIIIRTIQGNKKRIGFLKKLPEKLLSDTKFCIQMLEAGAKLSSLPKSMLQDDEFCRAAVLIDYGANAVKFDKILWTDKAFTLYCLPFIGTYEVTTKHFQNLLTIINNIYPYDEDVNYELSKLYGYKLAFESHFLDCKKIVKNLLEAEDPNIVGFYQRISSRLKQDKEIASKAMQMDFNVYNHIHPSLKNDIELLKKVVNAKPSVIRLFNDKLKDNKELALTAINRSGKNFKYLSKRLKNDKAIIMLAIEKFPGVFKDIPVKHRNDINIAKLAVSKEPVNLIHVSSKTRSDKPFIKYAILRGASLKHASKALKADQDLVRHAVTQYDSNLHFADKSIKENKNFLLKHFPLHVVFRYCSSKILQDKEIFIDGLNLDIRLLQRRGMSPAQMLDMEYEGVQATQRHKIFTYYKNLSKEKDIFLLAKAKSIICGI